MATEAVRVFGVVAFAGGREKREIPVFGNIPVEGVEGVDEDKEKPVKK